MKPFIVIVLGRFLEGNSIEVALTSFAEFYHSVSHKYQKHSQLIVIDKQYNHNLNEELAAQYKIKNKTTFLKISDQEKVESSYKEGCLLLLPRKMNSATIIKEAFAYSLPVLGYSQSSHDGILDESCGMKVKFQGDDHAIEYFANSLRLLKYDPEAVKMLKKGASNKYEREFNWSSRQVSR